ncbi:MAG TPA: glycosyltransferase family 2 protein [Candidatus Hydrogenedentes bacterium]|nr:glycosyltransferase family 2 protein [Candidatus Hydrogenedentota bacterium]HOS02295.1 glycosyltransferase family 2 protein [Candidatus Hydrogenedentota bacterium]
MEVAEPTSVGVSIVVPLYNERENIAPLHDALLRAVANIDRRVEILLVNDGSADGTREAVNALAAKDPSIRALHFRRNFGQTAALQAGIEYARGEVVVMMDGDLQNDPEDIPALLAKLDEGYDVVSGWRQRRRDAFLSRVLPSAIANRIISLVSGVHLHDYGCTLKAYRRSVLKDVRLYGEMHRFIPIYCSWLGGKVTEMPVNHRARTRGKSKYGAERIAKVILDLVMIRFMASYQTRPIHFFGGLGIISILLSAPATLYALWLKFFSGIGLTRTPLLLLAAMLIILGVMFIVMGILAEMIIRVYYETQDKKPYVLHDE